MCVRNVTGRAIEIAKLAKTLASEGYNRYRSMLRAALLEHVCWYISFHGLAGEAQAHVEEKVCKGLAGRRQVDRDQKGDRRGSKL